MSAAPAPFRVVRGSSVAAVALLLSAAAHGLASGGSLEPGALALPSALLVLAACIVASGRAWTIGRLVGVLAGVQVVAHAALALGTPTGTVDPRLVGVASVAQHHGHAHAAALTPTMIAAHAVAVLAAAVLLARVDLAVTVLWHLTRTLLRRRPLGPAPVPAAAGTVVDALLRTVRPQPLDLAVPRRGPPAVLARA